ncbi:MAG: GNAT family N-acetyltransferase [Cyclobacteriaceae bacterium]|jgi:N-acetylglutamate synthase-like GNAT family acetyltransferase|nr:GNAT family N-acetyltransferase [Cyclobacteriaceae bacterium]
MNYYKEEKVNIRSANNQDLPKIVNLLKQSLGESLMPKSENFWRWKHVENPFGQSPVLIAEENSELIGVRAFMQWHWKLNGKTLKAARAVDTATHPNHQGKGIFKKLTLQLIEDCKQNHVDFIFNTPNKNSMPGYLKMGWIKAGRLPIRLRFITPFEEFFFRNKVTQQISWEELEKTYYESNKIHSTITTPKSINYLKWRYQQVPVATYQILKGEENEFVIYRIKEGRLKELRVVEYLSDKQQVSKTLWIQIKIAASKHHARVITLSGKTNNFKKGVLLNVGPIVTIRQVSRDLPNELFLFINWSPSLGDLELF